MGAGAMGAPSACGVRAMADMDAVGVACPGLGLRRTKPRTNARVTARVAMRNVFIPRGGWCWGAWGGSGWDH